MAGRRANGRGSAFLTAQWRAALEPARLVGSLPALVRAPSGDGSPVVVLPGLTTNDAATAPLRAWLRTKGWDARGWGLGTNDGRRTLVGDVTGLVRAAADEAGRPVGLVGWSLGGTIARSVAAQHPDVVDRVVTFGSPVDRRHAVPTGVAVTAIVSRRDGVVAYGDQRDQRDGVALVEVPATHVGMTLAPEVWLAVAEALRPGAAP